MRILAAVRALATVAAMAKRWAPPGLSAALQQRQQQAPRRDSLRHYCTVVGRNNSGKSTLINALLGHLSLPLAASEGALPGVLPMSRYRTTPVPIYITYGESPLFLAVQRDGRYAAWPFERFYAQARIEVEHVGWEDIYEFRLHLPVELCQRYLTLVDTPGLDDTLERNRVTATAVSDSDTVIFVMQDTEVAGIGELAFLHEHIQAAGVDDVMVVVNLFGANTPAEWQRIQDEAWERLVVAAGRAQKEDNRDFAAHQIFFIDCRAALRGKVTGDCAQVAVSGLAALEQALDARTLQPRLLHAFGSIMGELDTLANWVAHSVVELQERIDALEEQSQRLAEHLAQVRQRQRLLQVSVEDYTASVCGLTIEALIGRLLGLPGAIARRLHPVALFSWSALLWGALFTPDSTVQRIMDQLEQSVVLEVATMLIALFEDIDTILSPATAGLRRELEHYGIEPVFAGPRFESLLGLPEEASRQLTEPLRPQVVQEVTYSGDVKGSNTRVKTACAQHVQHWSNSLRDQLTGHGQLVRALRQDFTTLFDQIRQHAVMPVLAALERDADALSRQLAALTEQCDRTRCALGQCHHDQQHWPELRQAIEAVVAELSEA
jgi:hypothetical protein